MARTSTPQAAKWNIDRILDPEVKSWVRPYYEDIEQVEAVDKYTLRIRMKEPSGALPIALGGYFQGIPMASPKAFETYGQDWLRHPVGTGPFIFKEWIPGKHVILEKNPHYFKKGLPYLDTLEFRVMKDPADRQHGVAGGGDRLLCAGADPAGAHPRKEPGHPRGHRPGNGPDRGVPEYARQTLRRRAGASCRRGLRARSGRDRQGGVPGPRQAAGECVSPGVPDAIDLNEMYPYSPEEAKRLLKELGFDEKNPLRFTILIGNQDATLADVATLIKNQMAKIGVEAKITLVDAMTHGRSGAGQARFRDGRLQLGQPARHQPALRELLQGAAVGLHGHRRSQAGGAWCCQWRRTLDAAGRKQSARDMQRLLAEQLYWVNVTGYPFFQAYRTYVKNYPFHDQARVLFGTVWLEK